MEVSRIGIRKKKKKKLLKTRGKSCKLKLRMVHLSFTWELW